MARPIPYNGNEPFIFISYSHKDSEVVLPVIDKLSQNGYRIWYDDGIKPGSEWDEYIATKVNNCFYFIAFISDNYLNSENCKDELNFARDKDKNKNMLLVYLSDIELSAGMAMRLGRVQAIQAFNFSNLDEYYNKILEAYGIGLTSNNSNAQILEENINLEEPRRVSNNSPKRYLPDTGWSRWGVPGFRTNKISHKIGSIILYILSIGLIAYLIDDYKFYIDKYNGKTKAVASICLAVAYVIMLLFSINYGWVQDSVFKVYRKPGWYRALIIVAVDLLVILLALAFLFMFGILG